MVADAGGYADACGKMRQAEMRLSGEVGSAIERRDELMAALERKQKLLEIAAEIRQKLWEDMNTLDDKISMEEDILREIRQAQSASWSESREEKTTLRMMWFRMRRLNLEASEIGRREEEWRDAVVCCK